MNKPNKKILFVGGGTAGHVTPLIATIEELLASGFPSSSIFLVTDKEIAKMDYISGHQIEVHTITSGKFNRFFTLSNLLTPFKVIAGFFQSMSLLKKIRPDVVLAKGAYVSAPLVYAAARLHIPIYLHESDSVMGATNRRLAKYAEKIFVTFPLEYYNATLRDKLIVSGLPIRKRFFDMSCHLEPQARDLMGSLVRLERRTRDQNSLPRILVWGGSQGADKLNHLIIEKLPDYLRNFELYHVSGERNLDFCQRAKSNFTSELQERYHLYGFLGGEIEKVVAGCDLVVSRAGATSLFELAAMGRAVIAIPYPYAAANHQYKNAEYFEAKGAVVLMEEKDLDAKELMNKIFSLLENNIERNDLRKNILNLAPKDAARMITEEILKLT